MCAQYSSPRKSIKSYLSAVPFVGLLGGNRNGRNTGAPAVLWLVWLRSFGGSASTMLVSVCARADAAATFHCHSPVPVSTTPCYCAAVRCRRGIKYLAILAEQPSIRQLDHGCLKGTLLKPCATRLKSNQSQPPSCFVRSKRAQQRVQPPTGSALCEHQLSRGAPHKPEGTEERVPGAEGPRKERCS